MLPRSFVTSFKVTANPSRRVARRSLRGIAFGGDKGVRSVDISTDGTTWMPTELDRDEGRYSFRRWSTKAALPAGKAVVRVRCTNTDGVTQPAEPTWNPAGFMRNVIETTTVHVA